MTALVTEHLPLVAEAPEGIKKLRGLILDLAIQGKLVEQDACEGTSSKLLSQIDSLKADFLRKTELARFDALACDTTDLCKFTLPRTWSWRRLGALGLVGSSSRVHQKDWQATGVPFYRTREIVQLARNGSVEPDLFISDDLYRDLTSSGPVPASGDIMITGVGTIGVPYIVRESDRFYFKDASVLIFKNYFRLNSAYLALVFSSPYWDHLIHQESMGTTVHTLTIGRAGAIPIPLPPPAEQQRIVAKVDELMALCDRLEADQADAQAAHAQLVQALLGSLTQATDAADFRAHWQRLSEHFHTLFTTEASIDALKQTVLQLAVMGKLVPQDSADELPVVLLERIAHEIATETLSNGFKKSRKNPEVEPAEQYVDTPSSWTWTRLGSQVLGSGAGWSPSCEARRRLDDEWGVLKVSAVSWGEFRPEENKALPANLEARPEHEVQAGDFLVSRANTAELVARSVVVETPPPRLMLSDKIVRFRLTAHCNRRYINLVNSSPFARTYYGVMAGGTSSSMKNVTREQILNLPLPLPPLAEQHRIVAKVDELMALCDQLKTQLAEARQQHAQLATALIEQAVA